LKVELVAEILHCLFPGQHATGEGEGLGKSSAASQEGHFLKGS
jgi:hypothetical protein